LRPLEIAGLVLLVALIAGGATIAALAAVDLPRGVLEETSTPIPGSRDVRLEARKYNVFYDGSSTDEPIPRLTVLVEPAGGGAPPQLQDFGGSLNFGNAQAIATVEVPRAGAYRIRVAGEPGPTGNPSVVLGEPTGRLILRVVLGGALAFLGFIGSVLLIVISLVRRRRR
jgi:hypothetical protein